MTNQEEMHIRIFYSWQSDIDSDDNRYAIRDALNALAPLIRELNPGRQINFVIDEATSNMPGSPNIPQTILDKIRQCDIFVSDITTVGESEGGKRKLPNPNVMFELGYAYAHLDWGRIILLFNSAYGEVQDAPFDLDRQRISPYKKSGKANRKNESAALLKLLTDAVNEILKHSPRKPYLVPMDSEMATRRQRDIRYASRLMSVLHINVLLEAIDSLPSYIRGEFLYFWNDFDAVYSYPLTRTSDGELGRLFGNIHRIWDRLTSYGHVFSFRGNSRIYQFDSHLMGSEEASEIARQINEETAEMNSLLNELTTYIQNNYHEIDMQDAAKKWQLDRIAYDKSISS